MSNKNNQEPNLPHLKRRFKVHSPNSRIVTEVVEYDLVAMLREHWPEVFEKTGEEEETNNS